MPEAKKGLGVEFKEFLLRGNVVDLAVAVVIGIAFGAVVTALVKDIITFVSVAAAVFFLVVKPINYLTERRAKARAAGAEPEVATLSDEAALLQEIRDLLRQRLAG